MDYQLRVKVERGITCMKGRSQPRQAAIAGGFAEVTFASSTPAVVVPHNLARANWLMVLMGWR